MLTLENFDSAQVPHRPQRHPGVPPPMLSDGLDSACISTRTSSRCAGSQRASLSARGRFDRCHRAARQQAAATRRTVTYGLSCPFVANNAIHAIVLLPFLG
ncbi:hypothetical protein EV714DRAFT_282115 [Schizophyllum commune]